MPLLFTQHHLKILHVGERWSIYVHGNESSPIIPSLVLSVFALQFVICSDCLPVILTKLSVACLGVIKRWLSFLMFYDRGDMKWLHGKASLNFFWYIYYVQFIKHFALSKSAQRFTYIGFEFFFEYVKVHSPGSGKWTDNLISNEQELFLPD